jgi:hypothetical protein
MAALSRLLQEGVQFKRQKNPNAFFHSTYSVSTYSLFDTQLGAKEIQRG